MQLKSRIRAVKYRSYKGQVGKIADNILQRQFEADKPNQKWVTDVTEFKVGSEKLYLSPIMDLFNGEIIAFQTQRRPMFGLVKDMLKEAVNKLKAYCPLRSGVAVPDGALPKTIIGERINPKYVT